VNFERTNRQPLSDMNLLDLEGKNLHQTIVHQIFYKIHIR
jgi:hypothetical protein